MQLDEPAQCTSGGNPLLLIKFCIYCFPSGTNSLCTRPWESKKKLSTVLMWDLWNISFFGRGDVSTTRLELSLCFGVIGKTPDLISCKNFVKKNFVCTGHRNNVLARCDSIFPLRRCQALWNKTCTQLSLSQILFQNPKNYSLGDVQRFCHHSWCDSTVIFDQISNSSYVYLSSSRFWTATSLVVFYQLPSILKSRMPPKNVWSVQSLITMSLLHQYECFCHRLTSFETKFYGNSLFISTIHHQ